MKDARGIVSKIARGAYHGERNAWRRWGRALARERAGGPLFVMVSEFFRRLADAARTAGVAMAEMLARLCGAVAAAPDAGAARVAL